MCFSSEDFTNISTWDSATQATVFSRLSYEAEKNACNPDTLKIIEGIFNLIRKKSDRSAIFCNCERLGLKGSKLFKVYKEYCNCEYSKFIKCVLSSDANMMKIFNEKEKEMKKEAS